jgi:CRP-like cAMP-binding protein
MLHDFDVEIGKKQIFDSFLHNIHLQNHSIMTNAIQRLSDTIERRGLWERQFTLNRNEYLKSPERTDTNIYYVMSGSLRVAVLDGTEELTIRFGYKGSFITLLDSFFSGRPSEFYIQAIKKSELKAISKAAFMALVRESAENLRLWQTILEQLIIQQMEREQDLLTSSPLERYKRVLARSPQLFQEIPNKYIASYLRMTPETLSRIKKT